MQYGTRGSVLSRVVTCDFSATDDHVLAKKQPDSQISATATDAHLLTPSSTNYSCIRCKFPLQHGTISHPCYSLYPSSLGIVQP